VLYHYTPIFSPVPAKYRKSDQSLIYYIEISNNLPPTNTLGIQSLTLLLAEDEPVRSVVTAKTEKEITHY
jgi:hypothetical protein